jgi:ribonuclease P protein component
MGRRDDFATAVRGGSRGATRRLVVHLARSEDERPALVGFVVSRAVGGAVERNQVKRRLRGLMRYRLEALDDGALVVVRALPAAGSASSADLDADLRSALASADRGMARCRR